MKKGIFVFIKNELSKDFPKNNIMDNKEGGSKRPFFFALEDVKNKDILWLIPISSKNEKYENIYINKMKRYNKCDTLHFANVKGKKRSFLIQNMIPITKKYLDNIYRENNGKPVSVDDKDLRKITSKAHSVIFLAEVKNIDITFSNIIEMKKELISKMKEQVLETEQKEPVQEKKEKPQFNIASLRQRQQEIDNKNQPAKIKKKSR